MKQNRNVWLLVSLLLLVLACVTVYYLQTEDNKMVVDPALFKVPDLAKIDQVTLESRLTKIKLQYENPGWKVNGHFEADRQLITVLFATLEQTLPKRPVPRGQRDSLKLLFDSAGVSVRLFEGTALKKEFQVAGDARKKETFFRNDANSEPYLVTIPGYRVFVSQIFELTENGWRDKRIFDFSWRNFVALRAAFPADAKSDFSIAMADKFFSIQNMTDADTSKINTFLDDVSLLRADQIVSADGSRSLDSLSKTTPLCTIEIADIAKRIYKLSLFPPLKGEPLVLGVAFDHDLVLFEREKIYRIFKKRGYFRLKPQ